MQVEYGQIYLSKPVFIESDGETAVLFPKDSPIRNGLTATGALLKGDIVTAVRSAARMVPADTAIGQALATAEGIIDTAQNLGDKVHAVKALTGSGS